MFMKSKKSAVTSDHIKLGTAAKSHVDDVVKSLSTKSPMSLGYHSDISEDIGFAASCLLNLKNSINSGPKTKALPVDPIPWFPFHIYSCAPETFLTVGKPSL